MSPKEKIKAGILKPVKAPSGGARNHSIVSGSDRFLDTNTNKLYFFVSSINPPEGLFRTINMAGILIVIIKDCAKIFGSVASSSTARLQARLIIQKAMGNRKLNLEK